MYSNSVNVLKRCTFQTKNYILTGARWNWYYWPITAYKKYNILVLACTECCLVRYAEDMLPLYCFFKTENFYMNFWTLKWSVQYISSQFLKTTFKWSGWALVVPWSNVFMHATQFTLVLLVSHHSTLSSDKVQMKIAMHQQRQWRGL